MKKVTLVLGLSILMAMVSACTNSKDENQNKDTPKKVLEVKKDDLHTEQGYEKMLKKYGITLYKNSKFKKIKNTNDGINAIYDVNNVSQEEKEKVKKYIDNELDKLKKSGWGVEKSFGMAMKKESNYKVAIQITQSYVSDLKIHRISYSYGKVY